jgi:hypothetical protein
MKLINNYIVEKLHLSKDTKYKNPQIIVDMIREIIYNYLKDRFPAWFEKDEKKLRFEHERYGNSLEINLNFPANSNFDFYKIRISKELYAKFELNKEFKVKTYSNKHDNIKFTFEL